MNKEISPAVATVVLVLAVVVVAGIWFVRAGPRSKPAASQQTNGQVIGSMLRNPATVKILRERLAQERAKGLRP